MASFTPCKLSLPPWALATWTWTGPSPCPPASLALPAVAVDYCRGGFASSRLWHVLLRVLCCCCTPLRARRSGFDYEEWAHLQDEASHTVTTQISLHTCMTLCAAAAAAAAAGLALTTTSGLACGMRRCHAATTTNAAYTGRPYMSSHVNITTFLVCATQARADARERRKAAD